MDLNRITANLNFVTSSVRTIELRCQQSKVSDSYLIEFGFDISCSNPTVVGNTKFGKLLMEIHVTVKPEDSQLPEDTIVLVIEGTFSSPSTIPDQEFLMLLNVNGGAALYSIARAKVETISSLTYAEGKIVLPMVNILQFYQERNSTEQKKEQPDK